jgi:hypothetical protein
LHGHRKIENIAPVTLTDAWKELGVDPGADAETVRRAYLRLIKTRKPESDPAGFQRAREAYEIARASGDLESIASGSARRHHAPVFFEGPPAGEATETAGSSDSRQAPTAAPTAAPPGGGDRPQADIIFDGFSSAWNSVPASADQRQRLEIAREAVAVLPDDPRAHWLLVTTLSRLGPDTALADALRAGWRAGWPEFLEALLVRLPGRATREEIDAGFALSDPATRLAAAAAAVGWDPRRAGGLVVELCRTAMDAPLDARGDQVRDLPIPRLLDVILALHAAGAVDAAVEAQAALRGCLQESGLELALVHGPLGGIWTLTEEIGALPPEFPQTLRTAFAIATRTGDLSSAYIDASRLIVSDRGYVRRWATRLVDTAPNVAGILRSALTQQAAGSVERAGFQVSRLSYLVIPLALALVRMCTSTHDYSYTPPIVQVDTPIRGIPLGPERTPGSAFKTQLDVGPLTTASDDLCGPDGRRRGQLVCADVEALVNALLEHDCDASRTRVTAVRRVLRDKPEQTPDARFLTQVFLARWQLCGGVKRIETKRDDP